MKAGFWLVKMFFRHFHGLYLYLIHNLRHQMILLWFESFCMILNNHEWSWIIINIDFQLENSLKMTIYRSQDKMTEVKKKKIEKVKKQKQFNTQGASLSTYRGKSSENDKNNKNINYLWVIMMTSRALENAKIVFSDRSLVEWSIMNPYYTWNSKLKILNES